MLSNLLSSLFSRTFLAGVMMGVVLAVGGIYGYDQVRVQMAGDGAADRERYLDPIAVSDLMAGDVQGTVPTGWALTPLGDTEDTTFGALPERPTLLTVGATWCEPCTAQIPLLHGVQDSLDQNLGVMLISSEPRDSIRHFLDENGYSISAYAVDELPPALSGELIPRTYLIRPNGEVVSRHVGPAEWTVDVVQDLLTQSRASNGWRTVSNIRTLYAKAFR